MQQVTITTGNSLNQNAVEIQNSITINRTIPDNFLGMTFNAWPLRKTTNLKALSGTFSITGNLVTGVNTHFTTELKKGSPLYNATGGLIGLVAKPLSDLSATISVFSYMKQDTVAVGFTTNQNPIDIIPFTLTRSHDSGQTVDKFSSPGGVSWREIHFAVSTITRVGTTVTVVLDQRTWLKPDGVTYTFPQQYFFETGDEFAISNVQQTGFNGNYIITKVNGFTFTYTSTVSTPDVAGTTQNASVLITALQYTHIARWVNTNSLLGVKGVYTIFNTPQWATDTPGATNFGYSGSPGGISAPNLIGESGFVNLISILISKFGNKIAYYEIWNEPSFSTNGTSYDVNGSLMGSYFTGETQSLGSLVRLAKQYITINGWSSSIKVISPPPWSAGDIVTIEQMMDAKLGSYILNGNNPASGNLTINTAVSNSAIIPYTSGFSGVSGHIGLRVIEAYPAPSGRIVPNGTTLLSYDNTAKTITLSNNVTLSINTALIIGTALDYYDIVGVHGYHKPFSGDIFRQIAAIRALLVTKGKPDLPIYATELGYLDGNGTQTDQEYVNNCTAIVAETVLAGCDKAIFYSWDSSAMGISERPNAASNIGNTWLALRGQTFTKVLIQPSAGTITVS